MTRYRPLLLALAPLLAIAAACSSAPTPPADEGDMNATDPAGPQAGGNTPKKATTPGASGSDAGPAADPNACPYTGTPLDVSNFATCGLGGRCVSAKAFPPDQADQTKRLAPCTGGGGGFCVPEKILAAQGNYLPKSCRSVFAMEGRCTSLVFPDLLAQKDQLPQDSCDSNERCAPCYDPLGKATGACSSVSCDAPKEPFKPFAQCCTSKGTSRGTCLPSASLPPAAATGLEKKECPNAGDLCSPTEELQDGFKHPACKGSIGGIGLGSYDGVCVSTCVKMDFLTQVGTDQGNCSANSFCAPCKDPLSGAPTGAPDCPP